MVAFSWKVLLKRIPTRLNLARRNVLPADVSLDCVLCGAVVESESHLFLHCCVVGKIWEELLAWVEGRFITPPNMFIHWHVGMVCQQIRRFERVCG